MLNTSYKEKSICICILGLVEDGYSLTTGEKVFKGIPYILMYTFSAWKMKIKERYSNSNVVKEKNDYNENSLLINA